MQYFLSVQGSVTVEWEATASLQYWRKYRRLQGIAVRDSATSSVRRRQFCLTRQQHLKNSIKQHQNTSTRHQTTLKQEQLTTDQQE
jgi:hypothetical protein